jgi:multiple sugar transport system substrate-binding protein
LINSLGGRMGSDDGCRIASSEPQWRDAFELLEAFHKAGMPAYTQDQIRQAFAAGKVGIYVGSTSQVARMEQASAGRFVFRTLPYPRSSDAARLPAGGSIAVLMVRDPKRREAAFRFMKFATGPIGQTRVATLTGYMPGNDKALQDPALLGTFYEKNPNSRVGVEQLPFIEGWHNWGGANGVKIVDVLQEHTTAVVSGRQSAGAALESLTAQVQRLLTACGS